MWPGPEAALSTLANGLSSEIGLLIIETLFVKPQSQLGGYVKNRYYKNCDRNWNWD